MVEGYKALDLNMRAILGNKMKYEIGKEYSVKGKLVMGHNGLHFCKKLESAYSLYDLHKFRIFKCMSGDEILYDPEKDKCVSRSLILTKEISEEEVKEYFAIHKEEFLISRNWKIRRACADMKIGLEKLVYDEDLEVRKTVADQGYGLDILVKDPYWQVRAAVADQGYRPELMCRDRDSVVRYIAHKFL